MQTHQRISKRKFAVASLLALSLLACCNKKAPKHPQDRTQLLKIDGAEADFLDILPFAFDPAFLKGRKIKILRSIDEASPELRESEAWEYDQDGELQRYLKLQNGQTVQEETTTHEKDRRKTVFKNYARTLQGGFGFPEVRYSLFHKRAQPTPPPCVFPGEAIAELAEPEALEHGAVELEEEIPYVENGKEMTFVRQSKPFACLRSASFFSKSGFLEKKVDENFDFSTRQFSPQQREIREYDDGSLKKLRLETWDAMNAKFQIDSERSFSYDSAGRLTAIRSWSRFFKDELQLRYDEQGRLSEAVFLQEGKLLSKSTYRYDSRGLLTAAALDSDAPAIGKQSKRFEYEFYP